MRPLATQGGEKVIGVYPLLIIKQKQKGAKNKIDFFK